MDQEDASASWKKISRALFTTPKPERSEAFVRRVLARVEELEAPQGTIWSLRWLAPAAAFAAAAVLLALSGLSPEPVSAEALLLQDSYAETPSSALEEGSEDIFLDAEEAR